MNAKLKKLMEKDPDIESELNRILFVWGYLSDPKDPDSLTEKALKRIGKVKYELSEAVYKQLKEIWPKGEWTSSLPACNAQISKMIATFPHIKFTEDQIIPAAKFYLNAATYQGKLAYFFFKDKDSRFITAIETMKVKTTQSFKER